MLCPLHRMLLMVLEDDWPSFPAVLSCPTIHILLSTHRLTTIRLVGVVFQSISINLAMFIAARFILGFGITIAHGARWVPIKRSLSTSNLRSPLLLTELVHPQDRPIFTTIYNTTWYLGAIVAAWLTFGTEKIPNNWSWRIPSIVQAFPSILQFCFIWVVPESPRWLVNKGREVDALRI